MKTAVEWLHSEYKRILGSVLVTPQQIIEMSDALENAKEIEKEQAELYAEFAILSDKSGNPVIPFNEFINIDNL